MPASGLDTVTFAPLTAAFCESVTVPVKPPVETETWPRTAGQKIALLPPKTTASANRSNAVRERCIYPPKSPTRLFSIGPGSKPTNCDRWAGSTEAELNAVWTWRELLYADGTLKAGATKCKMCDNVARL